MSFAPWKIRIRNQCNFGLFLPKFGCRGNSLGSLEIWDFFADPQKSYYACVKVLDFLHRTEVSAILAYFCSNLVAMATPLAPLKIQIAHWNSPAPKSTVHAKNFLISCREVMSAIFLPKFGCHRNRPDSHEILYTIFEFADPQNCLIIWQIPRFLAQNWNQCNFGLFLPKFGCHGNSLGFLEILDSVGLFEFADHGNPTIHSKVVLISCTQMK